MDGVVTWWKHAGVLTWSVMAVTWVVRCGCGDVVGAVAAAGRNSNGKARACAQSTLAPMLGLGLGQQEGPANTRSVGC
jgi:hypothetical protein